MLVEKKWEKWRGTFWRRNIHRVELILAIILSPNERGLQISNVYKLMTVELLNGPINAAFCVWENSSWGLMAAQYAIGNKPLILEILKIIIANRCKQVEHGFMNNKWNISAKFALVCELSCLIRPSSNTHILLCSSVIIQIFVCKREKKVSIHHVFWVEDLFEFSLQKVKPLDRLQKQQTSCGLFDARDRYGPHLKWYSLMYFR